VSRQAVVLAGGRGTRLGERTRDRPKYLIEVCGRPFAFWQLERLAACGFERVLLCVGHLGSAIRAAIGDGASLGLEVDYADDGERPLGTGGALFAAIDVLEPTFLVTYGDSYLPFDYAAPLDDLRAHSGTAATLAVYQNRGLYDRSNVRVEGAHVTAYDKRNPGELDYIDYGAMALRRSAVEELGPGESDMSLLMASLAARGLMRAFIVGQRFYEIGSEQGLHDLEQALPSIHREVRP
jgi:NDP-sugar pyrophosphorylase family protein